MKTNFAEGGVGQALAEIRHENSIFLGIAKKDNPLLEGVAPHLFDHILQIILRAFFDRCSCLPGTVCPGYYRANY